MGGSGGALIDLAEKLILAKVYSEAGFGEHFFKRALLDGGYYKICVFWGFTPLSLLR